MLILPGVCDEHLGDRARLLSENYGVWLNTAVHPLHPGGYTTYTLIHIDLTGILSDRVKTYVNFASSV